jgi:hypothetical protein
MMLSELCAEVFAKGQIPSRQRKDFDTSIAYALKAFKSTPELLTNLAQVEQTYKPIVRSYLERHRKGDSTIRNTLNHLSRLFRKARALGLADAPPTPVPATPRRTVGAFLAEATKVSPYRHRQGHVLSNYRCPLVDKQGHTLWPTEIAGHWRAYRQARSHELVQRSLDAYEEWLSAYVGYGLNIEKPPIATWADLFDVERVKRCVAWQAKRSQVSHISTTGEQIVRIVEQLAKFEERPEHAALWKLKQSYPKPPKMHNKQRPEHDFQRKELDRVGRALIEDGRTPLVHRIPHGERPGLARAVLFEVGLMLRLLTRVAMRQRCIREMTLGTNLYRSGDRWAVDFRGMGLKIHTRGKAENVYHLLWPEEIQPELEEYLQRWRPLFPATYIPLRYQARRQAPALDTSSLVFVNSRGGPWTKTALRTILFHQVGARTGKRLFPHLMRTLFFDETLRATKDIDLAATMLNITPQTALTWYHELRQEDALTRLADFNRLTLTY